MTVTGMQAHAGNAVGSGLLPGADRLSAHGLAALRHVASQVVAAGLAAADPRAGVARLVHRDGRDLVVGSRHYDLDAIEHVYLLGAGKATLPIAQAMGELLGPRLTAGLIVVQRGAARPVPHVEVRESDHPTPDQDSHDAAIALLDLARSAGAGDLVIACFTGGSSALASLPPDGVPFAAKQALHRLLLARGAPIEQINAVRKHVSAIKGGRLARAAAPAQIVNITLPDVVSGRLDCITDPTVADESSVAEAITVLRSRGLWDRLDPTVRAHLEGPDAQSPDLADVDVHSVFVSDGEQACAAMSATASALGYHPYVFGTRIEGEAHTIGGLLGSLAAGSASGGRPFTAPCVLLGAGGESVVTLGEGNGGPAAVGGPNQETALAFAQALAAADGPVVPVAAVFIDSDGSDGGTPNAGAIVDGCTARRAAELGVDLGQALLFHESSAALRALDDLVVTGPTGTNISDLWAVVIGAAVESDVSEAGQ
jgi:glycerate 2-kinase